jgi:hypothetical protein
MANEPACRLALCCPECAFGVTRWVGGEEHGALQERRRCGETAAGLAAPGRVLELGGDLLVRPAGGRGPVPGPPVRVGAGVGRLRQRRVELLPLGERRRPVGGRTGKRMPEPDASAELDQPRLHRGGRRVVVDVEQLRGPPDHAVWGMDGDCEVGRPTGGNTLVEDVSPFSARTRSTSWSPGGGATTRPWPG